MFFSQLWLAHPSHEQILAGMFLIKAKAGDNSPQHQPSELAGDRREAHPTWACLDPRSPGGGPRTGSLQASAWSPSGCPRPPAGLDAGTERLILSLGCDREQV